MIMQFEMSQDVGSRVWVSEDSGPLALSFGKPPWFILPLQDLLNLFLQLSQRGGSGDRILGIDTAIKHHATV